MKKQIILYTILFLAYHQMEAITINDSSATALNQVMLYGDSSFVEHSNHIYKEGDMFKILEQSEHEHPDADQKQKFKWYKVETPDQQVGWIFGDGLAIYVEQQELAPALRPYHRKRMQLGNGFDNAVTWIAAIHGRDNFHAQDYMNPLYNEYYLVVTNPRGRSVLMKCSGESARGETTIKNVKSLDITGDGHPEFIVQRGTKNIGSHIIERELEIYSFKAGTLVSIFQESLGLSYETGVPSPALYKHVEIEKQSIRISYLNYMTCDLYSQKLDTDARYPRQERCMEYVTSTYYWDKRTKSFKNPYGRTHISPQGGTWASGAVIKESPKKEGRTLAHIQKGAALTLIKHYENYVVEGGKKKIENWFFVQTEDGKKGYILSQSVGFVDLEHADILNQYYLNPPISKSDWKGDGSAFITFK